jgi:multidrug resistance efflux pump
LKSNQFKRRQQPQTFEPSQPYIRQNRINWGMLIYGTISLLIIFFLGQFLINTLFYVEAQGQVTFKQRSIQLPSGAQIVKVYKKDGDTVNFGDTLFRYTWSRSLRFSAYDGNQYGGRNAQIGIDWLKKELLETDQKLEEKKAEVRSIKNRIAHYEQRIAKIADGVKLDVYTVNELNAVQDRLSGLNSDLQEGYSTLADLKEYKAMLKRKKGKALKRKSKMAERSFGLNTDTLAKYSNYYTSPVEGRISEVTKKAFEVAKASDPIMKILQDKEIVVRAFFKQNALKYIGNGTEVKVDFPDGRQSRGRIDKIYMSTLPVPPAFRDKKQILARRIAADIKLLSPKPEKKDQLRDYYKMRVTVTKQTFKFPWF